MKFLVPYIKKHSLRFNFAIFFLTLEAMCDLIQPLLLARIIDVGITNKDINYVLQTGAIMLGVTLLGGTFASIRNILASTVSQKLGTSIRSDLFKHIQGFTFAQVDKFDRASLITRLTNDVTIVQNFTGGLMRIFIKAPLLLIGSIIMATFVNKTLALILVIIVPIIILFTYLNLKFSFPLFSTVQKKLDGVNGIMREYLSGVRVIKSFNRYSYENNRFERGNQELLQTSLTANRIVSLFSPSVTFVLNTGIIAVLFIGGYEARSGSIGAGQVLAFINYMGQILQALVIINMIFTMFVRAKASSARILEVFESDSGMIHETTTSIENKNIPVQFENVSFSYPTASGELLLKNISFQCNYGETLSIIGSTGAGKSTIMSLISRYYDTTIGNIRINGRDTTEIDPIQLRAKLGIVPQKNVLFSGTILDNIKWGKEDASLEEIIAAAKIAQAHDYITSFPEGYDTWLGQGGVNLSGGQKQRLALARALVRQPEILLLDDCTSAVDLRTEAKIRDGLKAYHKNLSMIIVAQKITSVIHSDRIIVLDEGEIKDSGTHTELLDRCSVYQDIYRSQFGKKEEMVYEN